MKKRNIFILIGAFVLSLAAVFVVLFTTSRVSYDGAVKKADELLSSKDVVSGVLNTKISSLSEFDAEKLEQYSATIREMKDKITALQEDKACKDSKFKERCDELSGIYEKLELSAESVGTISKFVKESQDVAGVSTDTLSEMKNSSNQYLQNMAIDLLEYREMINTFKEKYTANADDEDYVADYTAFDEKLKALGDKYANVDSKDLFGASNSELLSFYDKIEELKKLFAEE